MIKLTLKASGILLVFTVLGLTAGCGGSSSSASASNSGVATPASVSVVTTN